VMVTDSVKVGRVLTVVKVSVVTKRRVRHPSKVVQKANPSLTLRSDTTLLTDATVHGANVSEFAGGG